VIRQESVSQTPGTAAYSEIVSSRAPAANHFDSAFYNVDCLRAFIALRNFEFYILAFIQSLKAFALDSAVVYEDVTASFLLDEAVTFGIVEPFYFAGCHSQPPWTPIIYLLPVKLRAEIRKSQPPLSRKKAKTEAEPANMNRSLRGTGAHLACFSSGH
jgi:hypothetical protein